MKLKSVTMAAGIAQAAYCAVTAVNFVLILRRLSSWSDWQIFVMWPIGIVADALLAVFLITLAIRQK